MNRTSLWHAGPTLGLCIAVTACGWLHQGPGDRDIDRVVRQALDTSSLSSVNALAGDPLPTSASVVSVRPDDDCEQMPSTAGNQTFICRVSIVLQPDGVGDRGDTLHVRLQFTKSIDGRWQTSNIDRALAIGAAKALLEKVNRATPRVSYTL
ncbi:hypothetical protein [Burkholderia ubonensis]|uniref:hypothetical protein n=1 Tax=Burkholderia ubonensis TaxID=101571 RepID=UPI0008FE35D8|nr:hypothetical protein [Burkholderia ubonensis]